jgi:hypothetical protein
VGRRAHRLLVDLGLRDLAVDYLVVDTLRVPRATFAAIWEAWRDGYADFVAAHSRFGLDEVRAAFEAQLATLRDPTGYACWLVPVVSGRVP